MLDAPEARGPFDAAFTGCWWSHVPLQCLDDGSVHEVLKNFPAPEEAIARLGPRAHGATWHAWEHYWALAYQLH